MQRALDGIRVLDLTEGPFGGLATMVLADFGADVIKVEGPGGDPHRREAAAPLWLRGKRSRILDLAREQDRQRLQSLAVAADVIVTALPQDAAAQRGIDYGTLAARKEGLVYCELSAFGSRGPYAGYAPHEAVVMAKAGRMLQFEGLPGRDGPVYAALRVATHAASQSAVTGILAALRERDASGRGQRIETSLLRGLLPYEQAGVIGRQAAQHADRPGPARRPGTRRPLPTFQYHPVQTADGRWLQLGNLLPHLFRRFLEIAGLDADYDAIGRSDRPAQWPEELREGFRARLLERMQERRLAEWMQSFIADGGVAAHPYHSTQEALDDPDIVENGHVITVDGQRQLGFVAALTETPGRVCRPAPQAGADADAQFGPARPASAVRRRAGQERAVGPLAGVTVVEAATIIAAPQGVSLLADLGARVIKLEPLEGDPFRNMAPGGAARQNTGKEYLALDLKRPEAQRIAHSIIAQADLFIHNYRPGAPERLGLGHEALARDNPGLVYLAVNGYGPNGPGAMRPSTHPIPGAALGGVYYQIGGAPEPRRMEPPELTETARRLMQANEVNPDPNTSVVVATAALLGLQARQRNGRGQKIQTDMFGANAYANFDDFLRYQGKPPRRPPDREGFGIDATWRLYPCAEGWIFLAIADADEWRAFTEASGFDGGAFARDADDTALAEALGAFFAERSADDWEALLAPRGIGCVRADGSPVPRFLFEDPQARAEELLLEAEHPDWGRYLRHGPMVRFSETPAAIRGPGRLGQDTDAVLAELGYARGEIDALREGGIIR